ncbi:MAG: type II toxin-antitoxin system VapC family toxin [Azoarcus sp.]|nr:type II toxin-antitoxin system VapC family toxin [Azoarcus sp.]
MNRYMLDTNICIYLIKKHPPEIVEKFDAYRKGEIIISSITWAELCCGITKDGSDLVQQLLSILEVAPFGVEQSSLYGELTRLFPNRKANLDRMIAAHAISLNVQLVTNNSSDFEIYKAAGLKIDNWVKS